MLAVYSSVFSVQTGLDARRAFEAVPLLSNSGAKSAPELAAGLDLEVAAGVHPNSIPSGPVLWLLSATALCYRSLIKMPAKTEKCH